MNVTYPFVPGSSNSGLSAGNPANADLKWETTSQADFGLDFGLFDDRLTLEADYYTKETRDLLLNKSVPNYQGGGSVVSNIGSIRNSGVDLSITGRTRISLSKLLSMYPSLRIKFLTSESRKQYMWHPTLPVSMTVCMISSTV